LFGHPARLSVAHTEFESSKRQYWPTKSWPKL
jgi:hypothetical protein